MTTVEALADELGMDDADIRVWISEQLELDLHDDELPDDLALEVRDAFSPAGERALPRRDHEVVAAYRTFGGGPEGPELLDQLHTQGLRLVAHALVLERVLPLEDGRPYSEGIDAWLAGGPQPHVLTPPRRR